MCHFCTLPIHVASLTAILRTDVEALNARRAWIIEQLATLIRNGAIPKDDQWIKNILDWFIVHGLFVIKKRSEKSPFLAVRRWPSADACNQLLTCYLPAS